MKHKTRAPSITLLKPLRISLIGAILLIDSKIGQISAPVTETRIEQNRPIIPEISELDEFALNEDQIQRTIARTSQIEMRAEYRQTIEKLNDFQRRLEQRERRNTIRREFIRFRDQTQEEQPEIYGVLRVRFEDTFRRIDLVDSSTGR